MKRTAKLKTIIFGILISLIISMSLLLSGCSESDMGEVMEVASSMLSSQNEDTEKAEDKTSSQKETKTTAPEDEVDEQETESIPSLEEQMPEDGEYYVMEQVAAYINIYGHLPDNYITKDEAYSLGWEPDEGNLWDVAEGKCIGGDQFYNNEGNLPKKKGRKYYECDVNYEGGYRGAERLVYSNDGLVYYTPDHYESFIKFFGDE